MNAMAVFPQPERRARRTRPASRRVPLARRHLRLLSLLLALSLVPMLAFLDHWATAEHLMPRRAEEAGLRAPMHIHPNLERPDWGPQHVMPGMSRMAGSAVAAYGQAGQPSGHVHSGGESSADEAHEHAGHCHLDSASCSDVPLLSIGGFALMNESVALLGMGGLLLVAWVSWWAPWRSSTIAPELRPPRMFASFAA